MIVHLSRDRYLETNRIVAIDDLGGDRFCLKNGDTYAWLVVTDGGYTMDLNDQDREKLVKALVL